MPDNSRFSTALGLHSPSLDGFRSRAEPPERQLRRSPSPTDNRPAPILRSASNFIGSSSHVSHSSHSPHPSPRTPTRSSSIRWAANSTVSRDNNHLCGHCRKRNAGSTERGERDAEYHSSFRLSPLPSAHSDVTGTHTSPTYTHVDAKGSCRVTRFFRKTIHRVRRSSSSLSGETDTVSNTAQHDGQKGDCGFSQKQKTVLDNLEERLEAANKLHGENVDLQTLYESGTVATMKDFRATALPRPLPEDNALFNEADMLLADIRQLYEELNMFWKEEIRKVAEFLKKGRTDPRDLERWDTFRSSLEQTIESSKNRPPSDGQTPRSNITSSSPGVDLGEMASSLSSAIGSLGEALERISSSSSLQYSLLGLSYFQRVYVAFAGHSDLCLSFLQHCADYGEKVLAWCFPSIPSPTSTQVDVQHVTGLPERATGLRPELTGSSTKCSKTLEGMGSVGPPLRGLGTHPAHRLSTGTGTPPTHHASPEPTLQCFMVSRASYKDAPKPDIVIAPPACEPQGLQSAVGLGNGSGVSLPAASQSSGSVYRTSESIEDMQRVFDQDTLPRRPRESFFHLTWLALRGKVFVLLSIYTIVSLAFGLFHVFGTTRPPGVPQ